MIDKLLTFYTPRMAIAVEEAPEADKPRQVAVSLEMSRLPIQLLTPEPVTPTDLALAHHPDYVAAVLAGSRQTGFGYRARSADLAATLPTGALLAAARAALEGRGPCAALASGFRHAGYNHGGIGCTFNGLMVAALKLMADGSIERLAIIDADHGFSAGTDEILSRWRDRPRQSNRFDGACRDISHHSLGRAFHAPWSASAYLERMRALGAELEAFEPELILYQAGTDASAVLSDDGLFERDCRLFEHAARLRIPVAWCIGGGYEQEPDGSIPRTIDRHIATFRAALRFARPWPEVEPEESMVPL